MGDLLQARVVPDELARDCRNCVNARFGRLTHCVIFGEDIVDEARTAAECDVFELEEIF